MLQHENQEGMPVREVADYVDNTWNRDHNSTCAQEIDDVLKNEQVGQLY